MKKLKKIIFIIAAIIVAVHFFSFAQKMKENKYIELAIDINKIHDDVVSRREGMRKNEIAELKALEKKQNKNIS